MKMKTEYKVYLGGVRDHFQSLLADRLENEEQSRPTPLGRVGRSWQRLLAVVDLVVERTAYARCKLFGHDWDHEESTSAEVGFWCESWCKRCGWSSGRKWM
jgi:hypothetical protein